MTSPRERKKDLPVNLEMEKALLGAILLDNAVFPRAIQEIEAGDFHSQFNRLLFEFMGKLFHEGKPIDPLTLTDALTQAHKIEAAGGPAYISGLPDGVPLGTDVAVGEYLKIIKSLASQRETIRQGYNLSQRILDGASAEEITTQAEKISRRATLPPAAKKAAVVSDHEYPRASKTAFYGLAEPYKCAFEQSTNASDNYHLAAFLTMTGILFGKTILTQEGGDDIYPNLYTVIVGKAGFARKDSANNRAIKFLKAVDPDVAIVETIGSIEQFIGYMQNHQRDLEKGGYNGPFRILLRFRELQGLIAKAGQKATGNIWSKLCELYDCPDEMTTAVKTDNAIVKDPVGAMQGATCPEWLRNMSRQDLEAGPGRRILWVPGDPKARIKRRQPPLRAFLDPVIQQVRDRMNDYRRRAEPTVIPMTQEATDFIDEWAEKHESRSSGNDLIDTLTAGDEVAVRKVALIHAGLEAAKAINLLHLKAAVAYVEFLFEGRFPIFSQHGMTPMGEIEDRILKKVLEAMPQGIWWRDLRRNQGRVPIGDFNRVMQGLTMGLDPELRVEKRFSKSWVFKNE